MKPLSLNALEFLKSKTGKDLAAILVIIDHPDLSEPIRVSTDNATRLGLDPVTYGTMSKWGSPDGKAKPFYCIGMDVALPDEGDDVEPTVGLLLNVAGGDVVDLLTSTSVRATCRMAVVMANTPDLIEMEVGGLELKSASGDWMQVKLMFSMEDLYDEPVPFLRFSRSFFPGIFK